MTAQEARKMADEALEESLKQLLKTTLEDIEWKAGRCKYAMGLDLSYRSKEFKKRIKKELRALGYKVSFEIISDFIMIKW